MQLNIAGKQTKLDVSDLAFGQEYNEALVHQVVVAHLAAARAGTSAQKSKAEVSGGGKKPWKQKGTGRARAGSIRSPLWRGGGVNFARKTRNYEQKVNRKMYRGAVRSILSELLRQDRLVIVEDFKMAEPRTKLLLTHLVKLNLENVLIVTKELEANLILASRNLHQVGVCEATDVNPVNLLSFDKVLVTTEVVKHFEEWLA